MSFASTASARLNHREQWIEDSQHQRKILVHYCKELSDDPEAKVQGNGTDAGGSATGTETKAEPLTVSGKARQYCRSLWPSAVPSAQS